MNDVPDALRRLGWDAGFAACLEESYPDAEPGRVARVDRGGWVRLVTRAGDLRARLHPRFRRTSDPLERPTVGDWVAVPAAAGDEPIVEVVLPRRTALVRNTGGDDRDVSQALAANVDTAFLALPLDGDRNPRRTDRLIMLVHSGGVAPVLVLTKADREDAAALAAAQAEAAVHGAPVHPVSALTGEGIAALEPYLGPGRTVVVLGVSGAGKSTLVNHLLGDDTLAVGRVRRDGRGRHITTHRALVSLEQGAVLIDTPGLRTVAGWNPGVEEAFGDVQRLASACRFSDCAHEQEPGCAIREALATGALIEERWRSYVRLRAEQAALAARRSARVRDRGGRRRAR